MSVDPSSPSSVSPAVERALEKARNLKEKARIARLEADKMDTILTLEKIDKLEQRLSIGSSTSNRNTIGSRTEYTPQPSIVPPNIESLTDEEIELFVETERENDLIKWEEKQERNKTRRVREEEEDIRRQIRVLRDHLEVTTSTTTMTIDADAGDGDGDNMSDGQLHASTTGTGNAIPTTPSTPITTTTSATTTTTTNTTTLTTKELNQKVKNYLSLPQEIKDMYAKAVGMDYATTGYPTFDADAPAIVTKIHCAELITTTASTAVITDVQGDEEGKRRRRPTTQLELASAYAGFWRLPSPIKSSVVKKAYALRQDLEEKEGEEEGETMKDMKTPRFLGIEFAITTKRKKPKPTTTTMDATNANMTEVMNILLERDLIELTRDGVSFDLEDGAGSSSIAGVGGVRGLDDEPPTKNNINNDDMEYSSKAADRIKNEPEQLFLQLPKAMKQRLAKSVGIDDLGNTTAIVKKLIDEDKLKINDNNGTIEFIVNINDDKRGSNGSDGGGGIGLNGELLDDTYMQELLPSVTRKFGAAPSEEDVDVFFKEVLGKRTFNPVKKPQAVPGGYIIWGENKLPLNDVVGANKDSTSSSSRSDELVALIQEELDTEESLTEIKDRLQFYYMVDPTSTNEEMIGLGEEYDSPVLYVTGRDIKPNTNKLVKPGVSLLSGVLVVAFAAGLLNGGSGAEGGEAVKFQEMLGMVIAALFLPQFAHEVAHRVVAFKDEFKIGLPTIIPSIQIGLQGSITPILTPPKNFNSLFDFAIAGPLTGLIISIGLLYLGLSTQVFMDTAAQAQLPAVPVELLRASSLGGGIIEWLLGDGILGISPDDASAVIRLHPYAVGGYLGIVVNALNLLPIGNTDGGRVSTSVLGRRFARMVSVGILWTLLLAGIFGGDKSDVLFSYALYSSFWQNEPEIPCRNEVDGVDDFRAIIAFGSAVLVALALVPLDVA